MDEAVGSQKIEKIDVGSVSTRVNRAKAWDTKPQALTEFPRAAGLPKDSERHERRRTSKGSAG
jgi:hypothetical protein